MPVATAADFTPPPALTLPLACHAGVDCFVQNYVDHAGPTPRDHHCGSQTYSGHDGSDFRLTSVAAQRRGVAVLAAAPGTVRALRDGVADHLIENTADQAAIAGRECGNGVVIDHPGGWQSQYCHMARGSLAVRIGQRVTAGERLGLVGLSGDTRFPHVHFSLRHDGKVVDPFAPQLAAGACGAGGGSALWQGATTVGLAYRPATVLNAGFAAAPVDMATIEAEAAQRPDSTTPALIFFGRAIGLESGDRVVVRVEGPDHTVLADSTTPIQHPMAQLMAQAGRRRPAQGWAAGVYSGRITVWRGGRAIALMTRTIALAAPGTTATPGPLKPALAPQPPRAGAAARPATAPSGRAGA